MALAFRGHGRTANLRFASIQSDSEAIETLSLFNEKATELERSSFLETWKTNGSGSFDLIPGPFRAVRKGGPSAESLKSFLLTFRLFHADRDGISIREISKLYERIEVDPIVRNRITTIRTELQEYLDGITPLIVNRQQIARRDLLDTWLYGTAAHLNRNKRRRLKSWSVEDDVRPLFEHEFEVIILTVLRAILLVRATNMLTMQQLDRSALDGHSSQ
jgi:hypothetical protein